MSVELRDGNIYATGLVLSRELVSRIIEQERGIELDDGELDKAMSDVAEFLADKDAAIDDVANDLGDECVRVACVMAKSLSASGRIR